MVFTGKTEEEALLVAEKETGRNRNEFLYKVIEKKTGLFKGKEVEIEITAFKQAGKLGIKDGKLFYCKGDVLPALTPGKNVSVKVNGNIIRARILLKENDDVSIEPLNTSSDRKMELEITEDKLFAYINIEYTPERKFEIINKDPSEELVVEAILIKEEFPQKYARKDFEEILSQHKIRYGIRWEDIPSILNGGRHLIAEGSKPEKPVDDEIRYYFNPEDEKKPLEIGGKVDYYSIGSVDAVEAGALLALRIEGREGKTGYDVYGSSIPSSKRKTYKIRRGPGCDLMDNGNRAIAAIRGLASFKGSSLCVFPVYNINSDVDLKTGNIEFDGDIVVRGNVKEGMKVTAGNNITIYGNAADSVLTSSGNIKVEKNLISSTVKAGNKQLNDANAFEYIKHFKNLLDSLLTAYNELQQSGRLLPNINVGQLFKLLLESRLNHFKDRVNEGIAFISRNNIREDMANLWKDAVNSFKAIERGELSEINSIITLNHFLSEFIEKYQIVTTPADVLVYYCQNSSIFSTNNVEVKGKGCYNTNIVADNKVIFTGYPGIMRGGQIYAANGIIAREVGSNAGVATVLKTSKSGTIEASVVYQNTIICIGEQVYKVENPVRSLKAHIEKGELVVEKLKL